MEALARCGVGQLTLIDLDHVAESNINRQIHALDTTVGMAKVHAMRERIAIADVPKSFQGAAIGMITAGLMSLAFMGFTGLIKL